MVEVARWFVAENPFFAPGPEYPQNHVFCCPRIASGQVTDSYAALILPAANDCTQATHSPACHHFLKSPGVPPTVYTCIDSSHVGTEVRLF